MKCTWCVVLSLLLLCGTVLAQPAPHGLRADVNRLDGTVELGWYAYNQSVLTYHDNSLETGWSNNGVADRVWAQKLIPDDTVTLNEIHVYVFEAWSGSNWVPMNDVQLRVFDSSGGDTPGDLLYTSAADSPDMSGWVSVDVSGESLSFSGEFWVGVSFTVSGGPFVGFDESNPQTGVLYAADPPYTNWSSLDYFGGNVALQVLVESDAAVALLTPAGPSEITPANPALARRVPGDAWTGGEMSLAPIMASTSSELDEFIEYKVYRDGSEVASVTDNHYTDTLNEKGSVSYEVTAVHSDGESNPTNEVDAYWSGQVAPPLNVQADTDLSTGDVTLTWDSYDWGTPDETLAYYQAPGDGNYYWVGATFCTMFQPAGPVRLLSARFYLMGASEFGVQIFDFDGDWPDELLYEYDGPQHDPGWVTIDLCDQDLFFEEPFVLGFHDLDGSNSIGYNEDDNNVNFSRRPDGSWGNFNGELQFFIEAVVEFPDGNVGVIGGDGELDDLTGFDIYRNGSLLTSVGAGVNSYVDALPEEGLYNYYVVANYDEGSATSRTVSTVWQQNLLPNGDFEAWTGGEPDAWNVDIGNNATIHEETSLVQHGSSAVRLELVSETTKKLKQEVPADVGDEFTFQAWVYDDDEQGQMQISILFRDENGEGAQGEQEGVDQFTSAPTGNHSSWQQFSVTGVAPENTVDVRVYLRFMGSNDWVDGATLYVDNAALFGPSTSAVTETAVELPSGTEIAGVYPNPFNPETRAQITLQQPGMTKVVLYNVLGEQVALLQDGMLTAGRHTLLVDGRSLSAGMYFLQLQVDGKSRDIERVLLLK